jgi:hypothetical protein
MIFEGIYSDLTVFVVILRTYTLHWENLRYTVYILIHFILLCLPLMIVRKYMIVD